MARSEAIEILENGDFWDLCVVPYVHSNMPAIEFHRALDMAIAALRAQQEPVDNDPLTLEELRGMDGEPVWIAEEQRYALLRVMNDCLMVSLNRLQYGRVCPVQAEGRFGGMTFYRRRPEDAAASTDSPFYPAWAHHLRTRFERTE